MKRLTLALAVVALAAFMAPRADAALALRVYDSTNTLIYQAVDGGVNDADGLLNGRLDLTVPGGGIGGLDVQGSFHTSNASFAPDPQTPLDTVAGVGILTSGSTSVTNQTAAAISQTVLVSSTDYGPFPPQIRIQTTAGGTWKNIAGVSAANSVYSEWFFDPSNTLFGTTGTGLATDNATAIKVDTYNGLPTTPGATVTSMAGHTVLGLGPYNPGANGLFSMTERFTLTLQGGTQLTSRGNNMSATAVPEPATMGMALVGLLGAAYALRRKSA